jgi:hypothetical protein
VLLPVLFPTAPMPVVWSTLSRDSACTEKPAERAVTEMSCGPDAGLIKYQICDAGVDVAFVIATPLYATEVAKASAVLTINMRFVPLVVNDSVPDDPQYVELAALSLLSATDL